jgi:hypothetical protein
MPARAYAFVSGLLALGVGLLPSVALACPYCAARTDPTHRTLFFIATMCLLPFVVAGAALAVIRRLDRKPDPDEGPDE